MTEDEKATADFEIVAGLDKNASTGSFDRFTVGKPGGPVSGALYISPEVRLPIKVLITIQARQERDL